MPSFRFISTQQCLSVNTDCKQLQVDQFVFESLCIKAPSQHVALFTVTPGCLPVGFSATIYLQFAADSTREWRYMGSLGEGKESAFFKVSVPSGIVESVATQDGLQASLGVSIVPTVQVPTEMRLTTLPPTSKANDSLLVAKKLLQNFVDYALSFSRTFANQADDTYIPAKIVTEWYNGTLRKAQMDPVGFVNRLLKDE